MLVERFEFSGRQFKSPKEALSITIATVPDPNKGVWKCFIEHAGPQIVLVANNLYCCTMDLFFFDINGRNIDYPRVIEVSQTVRFGYREEFAQQKWCRDFAKWLKIPFLGFTGSVLENLINSEEFMDPRYFAWPQISRMFDICNTNLENPSWRLLTKTRKSPLHRLLFIDIAALIELYINKTDNTLYENICRIDDRSSIFEHSTVYVV